MKEDFSELVKYLDKKFGKVDNEFVKIGDGFVKIEDRFVKIDEKFNKLFDVFATKEDLKKAVENLSTKDDFNELLNSVDAYAKKADTYFQEMVMLGHKVDRHEKWIQQIAVKLGVKLDY